MNAQQLQDVQKIPYFVTELDADGVVVMDAGDSAAVTVDANATVAADAAVDPAKVPAGTDPAKVLQTGFVVAGKSVGLVNVTVTYVHADGTPVPPPVTAQLQVVSGPPATGALGFGVPVSQ